MNKQIYKMYPLDIKLARDVIFVLELNNKYAMISFGENKLDDRLGIDVFHSNGDITFTTLKELKIPTECLVNSIEELLILGNNWLKNYSGSY